MKSLSMAHGHLRWRETGVGDPLVLLHGWSMSHAVFDELATLLEADFRLLIPDLPGHGRSDPLELCSFKAMAQLLEDWLAEIGCQKTTVLGWSLGGQLALQLASETTTLVERLILISSTACFCARPDWQAGLPAGELRALKRGLKKRYLATLGEFFDLQFKGEGLSAQRRYDILQFAVRPLGPPAMETALGTLDILGAEDLRPLLAGIKSQSLILHGELDAIIPLAAGRFLAAQIPLAHFVSMPHVGHAPFFSQPQFVARQIKDFCL